MLSSLMSDFTLKTRGGGDPLKKLSLALQGMPQRIRKLASSQIRVYVAEQIQAQYTTRTSMYGERWPTPKAGNAPMERSGRLRRGYVYRMRETATSVSIDIANTQPYAGYLQTGTKRMERRRHVPDKALPPEMRRGIDAIYRRAIQVWHGQVDFAKG
jgi:hypothetical protein